MLGKVPSDYVLKELEQIFRSTLQLSQENSQMLFLHVADKVVATNTLQGPTPHNLLESPRLFI